MIGQGGLGGGELAFLGKVRCFSCVEGLTQFVRVELSHIGYHVVGVGGLSFFFSLNVMQMIVVENSPRYGVFLMHFVPDIDS